MRQLFEIKSNFLDQLKMVKNLEMVYELEREYLGRKGVLTLILRELKNLPEDQRKKMGREANSLKNFLVENIVLRKKDFEDNGKDDGFDVTIAGKRINLGHIHPISLITDQAVGIFQKMGFGVEQGPDIEDEWHNFDALNIPADHPARDLWDTFWLQISQKSQIPNLKFQTNSKSQIPNSKLLLRTHTSPVQIRYMENNNPPFRIIVPGRVYRYEATDASHDIQFHQLEGLLVDKNISVADFKGVMEVFFQNLFVKNIKMRLRSGYFPFVEPGFEVDIQCIACEAKKKICSLCKGGGWIEIMGAGMVHPNVFKAVKYNPFDWQGFAFGIGLDRVAMIKYGINDIRLFNSGDLRFLKQF